MITKKAKTLKDSHFKAALAYVINTRYPLRNKVLLLLSYKAGLRSKEMAEITWSMVCTADSEIDTHITLTNKAAKGNSGRLIPMNKDLHLALIELKSQLSPQPNDKIIFGERGDGMTAHGIQTFFMRLYKDLNLQGCSSHSGRRTFITNIARNISKYGGSLKDAQEIAGHANLSTTLGYIESNEQAKIDVVNFI